MIETIAIIDLETTSLDTDTCEVVEVAVLKLQGTFPGPLEVTDAYWSLVHPVGPVPPEASAVHHLVDADLEGAPTGAMVADHLRAFLVGVDVLVGHNIARYDAPILKRLGVDLPHILDTLRLAHHAWPELEQVGGTTPSYGLEALRFRFDLCLSIDDWIPASYEFYDGEGGPHSAAFDVSVCHSLLDHAVKVLHGNGMEATTYIALTADLRASMEAVL